MRSLAWRRHRGAFLGYCALLVCGVSAFGALRITAVSGAGGRPTPPYVVDDIRGKIPLFDDTLVHTISVRFDETEYRDMIAQFQADNEKAYVQADIIIDGTVVEKVGMRLKGNSTLASLSGGLPGLGGGPPAGGGAAAPAAGGGAPGGFPAGGFGQSSLSVDEPEGLPWLIRFDEFVDGQRYQGLQEIAVRPSTGLFGGATTVMQEALALRMTAEAGEPAQRSSFSSFAINGSATQLRLIVEHPGDSFAEEVLGGDGVLYKGRATGRFTYLGEDPLAYANSFRMATRERDQDLKPLIGLIKWTNESTTEEFATGLVDRVDVESLARYIALHNIYLDFDDMGGPGNNGYYWYDLETKKFRVVTWDVNLAFNGSSTAGPFDAVGLGALFGGGAGAAPGGFPAGVAAGPAGGGAGPAAGVAGPAAGGAPAGGGGFPGGLQIQFGNPLKDRFLAEPKFRDLYLDAYQEVYDAVLGSGFGVREIDRLVGVLAAADGVDTESVRKDAASLRSSIEARRAALPAAIEAARSGSTAPATQPATTASASPATETSESTVPGSPRASLQPGVSTPDGSLPAGVSPPPGASLPPGVSLPPGISVPGGGPPGTPPAGAPPGGLPELPPGVTLPAPGSPEFNWGFCIFQNGGDPFSISAGGPLTDATRAAIDLCKDQQPATVVIPP